MKEQETKSLPIPEGWEFAGYENGEVKIRKVELEQMKSLSPSETVFSKQLMTIYRMCGNMNTNSGNRAVIESISKNKIALIFDDDELKSRILGGVYNPTRKGFVVDVSVQTVDDKPALYKVLRLHEIVDID